MHFFKKWLFTSALIGLFSMIGFTQEPTPTPPDESVKIITEEVKLNVMARNRSGKFVPTLTPDDLLIVEEGTPQTITSMRRVPANVLFLLDTGGDLTFAKSVALTRLTSKIVIDNLSAEDMIAAIQYSDKIEVVSDWSADRVSVFESLDKRLFPGKRSRLSDGLNAVVELFNSRALENRHLVLISDGLESVADEAARLTALQNILAANITIHVISYTQLEQQRGRESSKRINLGKGDTKPRVPEYIFEDLLRSVPTKSPYVRVDMRRFIKSMNESQRIVILTLDNQRLKYIRGKILSWGNSETTLQTLAEDTGGLFHAPEEPATMLTFALEIAGAIDSQYVVTYSPTNPMADLDGTQSRKVRVGTHCDGIEIRSRQKLVFR